MLSMHSSLHILMLICSTNVAFQLVVDSVTDVFNIIVTKMTNNHRLIYFNAVSYHKQVYFQRFESMYIYHNNNCKTYNVFLYQL